MTQLTTPETTGASKLAAVFAPNEALQNLGFAGVEGRTIADIHPHGFDHIAALVMLQPHHISCFGVPLEKVVTVEAMLASAQLPHEVSTATIAELTQALGSTGVTAAYDLVTIANAPTGQESTLVTAGSRLLKPGGQMLVTGGNAGFFSRAGDIERAMLQAGFPEAGSVRTWGSTPQPMGHNTTTIGINYALAN